MPINLFDEKIDEIHAYLSEAATAGISQLFSSGKPSIVYILLRFVNLKLK